MKRYRLKKGFAVKVHGIPVELTEDVVVQTETDLHHVVGIGECNDEKVAKLRAELELLPETA